MHHSLRRITLGAAIATVAAVAVPAAASAASTCSYDASTKLATINDDSFGQLHVERDGLFVAFRDDASLTLKRCPGSGAFATVNNTDRVLVLGHSSTALNDGYVIDQSHGVFAPGATPETDALSELEIQVRQEVNNPGHLRIVGTSGPDTVRVGGNIFAIVQWGSDSDNDISMVSTNLGPASTRIDVDGGSGGDFITGRGGYPNSSPVAANTPVLFTGGAGADTLVDGAAAFDLLSSGADDDTLFSVDGQLDQIQGGTGFDNATVDSFDETPNDVEQRFVASAGVLKVADPVMQVRAGSAARLSTLTWKHPQAWKRLRKLEVRLASSGQTVGSIVIRPKSKHISSEGAVRALAGASYVSHRGKTVKVRLAVRLPRSLAGEALRMDVIGWDRDGHEQHEPSAGLVRVAR
jgi:hypothetical protein